MSELRRRIRRALRALHLLRHRESQGGWDGWFEDWIKEGRRTGRDPNDIGDEEWNFDSAMVAEKYYLPLITPDSRVLELGPGTGRITRFLLPRADHMTLADYSQLVCRWLPTYLANEGSFEVHHLSGPSLPMVPASSVDVVVAHGVIEHLDLDDTFWFLEEFARVLRPGGRARFNYENVMSEGGVEFLHKHRLRPGHRNVFRFFHPETMNHLARLAGFSQAQSLTSSHRWAFLDAVR